MLMSRTAFWTFGLAGDLLLELCSHDLGVGLHLGGDVLLLGRRVSQCSSRSDG